MIDLHCHVLFGIDDGPPTIEDSLALVRAAAAAGTDTVVATPHVSWQYANDPDTIARLAGEVAARAAAEGLAIEIRAGAELAMTRVGDIDHGELARYGLGGSRWLLVEPPFTPVITGLDRLVGDLQTSGFRVLLAHPERCPAFSRDRRVLEGLVERGALVSITAGSLVGRFGAPVRRFAFELVRDGMVHNVSSDAHDEQRRPPGVLAELAEAGMGALADWLTRAVPAAILDGGEIPPRPDVAIAQRPPAGRRRWRWR